jgi:hypothetical protein
MFGYVVIKPLTACQSLLVCYNMKICLAVQACLHAAVLAAAVCKGTSYADADADAAIDVVEVA